MIRRTVALLALFTLILPAASVWPLGVGNIELRSALNEPLVARIPLRSLEAGDLEGMKVALGTAEQFQRAGLERPFFLTQMQFDVVPAGNGGFIAVTSEDPVAEPFLNFLLEVNWPRGRVIREYTVLLDPPVYGAAISSTVRQTVPTVATEPPVPSASSAPRPTPAPAAGGQAPSQPVQRSVASAGTYGPVTETDTLWSLSERFSGATGASVQQTMLAMLRANPEAFSADNVNTLRAGAVLRIPGADEVGAISRSQALEEVRRQHAQWQEMRGAMTAARTPPQPQGPRAGDDGTAAEGSESAAGDASGVEGLAEPAAATTDDDSRLELVGAGSDAAGAVGAPEQATDVADLREELTLAIEEAQASRRENQELSSRLTDAEALIEDLSRLLELKNENIAALQQQLAAGETEAGVPGLTTPVPAVVEEGAPSSGLASVEEPPPAPEISAPSLPAEPLAPAAETPPEPTPEAVAPAPEPPAAVVDEAEQPKKPTVPLPPPQPEPTSFMDILEENLPVDPLLLGGGVGALALLGGLFAMMRRRRTRAEEESDHADELPPAAVPTGPSMVDRYGQERAEVDDDADSDMARTQIGGDTVVQDLSDPFPAADGGKTVSKSQTTPVRSAREEEDPLAEVNNYLAYEHFDQAEDLVRRAVDQHPERAEYRVRLLDVLRQARNVGAFAAAAVTLRELVGEDSDEVQQANEWWEELAPGVVPFEAGDEAMAGDAALATQPYGADDDGIFDVTGAADVSGSAVDFDLGFEMTGPEDAADVERTRAESGVDFDLGDGDDGQPRNEAGSAVDFMLDAEDADGPVDAAESGLDFDLGFDDEPVAKTPGEAGEVDFDLGDETSANDDFDSEYQPGSDSALDFDLGEVGSEKNEDNRASVPGSASEVDFDLGSDAPETGQSNAGSQPGSENELDFDLGEGTSDGDEQQAGGASLLDFDLGDDALADTKPELRDVPGEAAPAGRAEEDFGLDLGEEHTEVLPVADRRADDLDRGRDGPGGDAAHRGDGAPRDDMQPDTELDLNFGDDSADGGELDFDLGMVNESSEESTDRTREVPGAGDDESTEPTREFPSADEAESMGEAAFDTVRLEPDDEGQPDGDMKSLFDAAADADKSKSGDDAASLLEAAVERSDSGLDLDLGTGDDDVLSSDFDFDFDDAGSSDLDLSVDDDDEASSTDDRTLVLGRGAGGELDEVQTKLDLAQAYIDMGDAENARGILGEVMADGSDEQIADAKALLNNL